MHFVSLWPQVYLTCNRIWVHRSRAWQQFLPSARRTDSFYLNLNILHPGTTYGYRHVCNLGKGDKFAVRVCNYRQRPCQCFLSWAKVCMSLCNLHTCLPYKFAPGFVPLVNVLGREFRQANQSSWLCNVLSSIFKLMYIESES